MDINMDMDMDELDTSWLIDDFELDYTKFQSQDINFLTINFFYLNTNSEIIKAHKIQLNLQRPNILSKEELIHIIKKNIISDNIKYSVFSLLKFNFNIDPSDIRNFMNNQNLLKLGQKYLQIITNIDNIVFSKSITLFHNLNNLSIFFKEKDNKFKMTKKSFINPNSKTKKKQYKDNTG
jgi:hypothetical protein